MFKAELNSLKEEEPYKVVLSAKKNDHGLNLVQAEDQLETLSGSSGSSCTTWTDTDSSWNSCFSDLTAHVSLDQCPNAPSVRISSKWASSIPSCDDLRSATISVSSYHSASYNNHAIIHRPETVEREITDEYMTKGSETVSGESAEACKFRRFSINGNICVSEHVTYEEVEDKQAETAAKATDRRDTFDTFNCCSCDCDRLAQKSEKEIVEPTPI